MIGSLRKLWDGIKSRKKQDRETLRNIYHAVLKLRAKTEDLDIKLYAITATLKRVEENQMATNPVIQRLVDEVEQTRGAVASAVVFIRSVPDLIRQAVTEALATNPGADLSMLEGLAESLDASQAELTAAMQANPSVADDGDETVVVNPDPVPVAEESPAE